MSTIATKELGETPAPPPPTPVPPQPPEPRVATKEQWAGHTVHTVHCHSGAIVRMRIPDVGLLIKRGKVPEHLRGVALRKVFEEAELPTGETPVADQAAENEKLISSFIELKEWLITEAVIEPRIDVDDLERLPREDLDMLADIATRNRYTDARGIRLGVARLDQWEAFPDRHGCPPDCQACAQALDDLSTVHLGRV